MLLPLGIAAAGLLLLLLVFALRSSSLLDLSLLLTAGSCTGAPLFAIDVGPLPLTLSRLWLLAILARAGWLCLRGQANVPKPTALDVTLFVYLAIATTSLFTTDWAFRNRAPVSLWIFYFMLPTAVYFVARTVKFEAKHIRLASWILLVFGAYLAITGILETQGLTAAVLPRYIVSDQYPEFLGRARGPFLNPVANGIAMSVCMVTAILWWPVVGLRGRIALSLYNLLLALGVYLTLTRSCWIGCLVAVGMTVMAMTNWRVRVVALSWGVLALAISGTLLLDSVQSFKRDKYVTEAQMAESVSLRPILAKVAWEMFKDRPVFGCGLGQYKKWDDPYLIRADAKLPLLKVDKYWQHNSLLSALVETGAIGLLSLLSLTVTGLVVATRIWQRTDLDYARRSIGILYLTLTLAIAVNGMFHDVLIITGMKMWWFAAAGLVAAVSQELSQVDRTCPPSDVPEGDASAAIATSEFRQHAA